jgi:hypothetical protein
MNNLSEFAFFLMAISSALTETTLGSVVVIYDWSSRNIYLIWDYGMSG